eukprot:760226-Hanusia_phi.AAC.3
MEKKRVRKWQRVGREQENRRRPEGVDITFYKVLLKVIGLRKIFKVIDGGQNAKRRRRRRWSAGGGIERLEARGEGRGKDQEKKAQAQAAVVVPVDKDGVKRVAETEERLKDEEERKRRAKMK